MVTSKSAGDLGIRRDIYLGTRVAISDFEAKHLSLAAGTGYWQKRRGEEGAGL